MRRAYGEKMTGKWIVNTKGGPQKTSFEISVIRRDNAHGIQSYGWFDENKLLISHNGGPCQWLITGRVWDKLLTVADEVANELNTK